MLNFTNMLKAPELEQPITYVATYSDGFGLKRKEIEAPTRLSAYAIATGRPPLGFTLTSLRKKKTERKPAFKTLADRIDVKATRALSSIYTNTDLACRFVMDEIRAMAASAQQ